VSDPLESLSLCLSNSFLQFFLDTYLLDVGRFVSVFYSGISLSSDKKIEVKDICRLMISLHKFILI
jgi:hypothetical protein